MGKRSFPLGVIRTSLRLCAIFLVLQFSLAGPAGARNCTSAEKSAADAQLWLNKRDKAAALALHMPWGVPDSSGAERILIQRDYVIGYSDSRETTGECSANTAVGGLTFSQLCGACLTVRTKGIPSLALWRQQSLRGYLVREREIHGR